MSEDFALYRGDTGIAHLLAPRCAHRGTMLSTGLVEGDCLRCCYHGWKYDATGQCIDQPLEAQPFARNVQIRSYPIKEYLGLIFAYLGDGEPPPFPRYPYFEQPGVLEAGTKRRPFNYFNEVENSMDPAHVDILHPHAESLLSRPAHARAHLVTAEETTYGMVTYMRRPNGAIQTNYLVMPTTLCLKVNGRAEGLEFLDFILWRVPIDDERFASFFALLAQVTGPAAERYRDSERRTLTGDDGTLAEAVLAGRMRSEDVLIQRPHNYVSVMDHIAQRGQGVMVNRAQERLAPSDAGVILLRKLWRRELQALAEGRQLKKWDTFDEEIK